MRKQLKSALSLILALSMVLSFVGLSSIVVYGEENAQTYASNDNMDEYGKDIADIIGRNSDILPANLYYEQDFDDIASITDIQSTEIWDGIGMNAGGASKIPLSDNFQLVDVAGRGKVLKAKDTIGKNTLGIPFNTAWTGGASVDPNKQYVIEFDYWMGASTAANAPVEVQMALISSDQATIADGKYATGKVIGMKVHYPIELYKERTSLAITTPLTKYAGWTNVKVLLQKDADMSTAQDVCYKVYINDPLMQTPISDTWYNTRQPNGGTYFGGRVADYRGFAFNWVTTNPVAGAVDSGFAIDNLKFYKYEAPSGDTTAPTAPTGVAETAVTQTGATITWSAATDDTAVTGYKVYVNGALKETLGNVLTYDLTGLSAGTTYSVEVTAIDAAANESVKSAARSVTTIAAPTPLAVTYAGILNQFTNSPTPITLTAAGTGASTATWYINDVAQPTNGATFIYTPSVAGAYSIYAQVGAEVATKSNIVTVNATAATPTAQTWLLQESFDVLAMDDLPKAGDTVGKWDGWNTAANFTIVQNPSSSAALTDKVAQYSITAEKYPRLQVAVPLEPDVGMVISGKVMIDKAVGDTNVPGFYVHPRNATFQPAFLRFGKIDNTNGNYNIIIDNINTNPNPIGKWTPGSDMKFSIHIIPGDTGVLTKTKVVVSGDGLTDMQGNPVDFVSGEATFNCDAARYHTMKSGSIRNNEIFYFNSDLNNVTNSHIYLNDVIIYRPEVTTISINEAPLDAAVANTVNVSFGHDINPATFAANRLKIVDQTGSAITPASVEIDMLNPDSAVLNFGANQLAAGATYTVTADSSFLDVAGKSIFGSATFQTAAPVLQPITALAIDAPASDLNQTTAFMTPVAFTATPTPVADVDVSTIQWYVDDVLQTGSVGLTYTYTPIAEGTYSITAKVGAGVISNPVVVTVGSAVTAIPAQDSVIFDNFENRLVDDLIALKPAATVVGSWNYVANDANQRVATAIDPQNPLNKVAKYSSPSATASNPQMRKEKLVFDNSGLPFVMSAKIYIPSDVTKTSHYIEIRNNNDSNKKIGSAVSFVLDNTTIPNNNITMSFAGVAIAGVTALPNTWISYDLVLVKNIADLTKSKLYLTIHDASGVIGGKVYEMTYNLKPLFEESASTALNTNMEIRPLFNSGVGAGATNVFFLDDARIYFAQPFAMNIANNTNVPTTGTAVKVDFNHDVNVATFDPAEVKVISKATGAEVAVASVDFDIMNPNSFTLNFAAGVLEEGAEYQVVPDGATKDIAMQRPSKLASFTTAAPTPDTTIPTSPTNSSASDVTQTSATITWTAATDNVGVTGYKVYVDGVLKETLGNVLTYDLTGLTANTTYNVTIAAIDAAGNESAPSVVVNFTTLAPASTSLAVTSAGTLTQLAGSLTPVVFTATGTGAATATWHVNGVSQATPGSTFSYTPTAVGSTTIYAQVGADVLTKSNILTVTVVPNDVHTAFVVDKFESGNVGDKVKDKIGNWYYIADSTNQMVRFALDPKNPGNKVALYLSEDNQAGWPSMKATLPLDTKPIIATGKMLMPQQTAGEFSLDIRRSVGGGSATSAGAPISFKSGGNINVTGTPAIGKWIVGEWVRYTLVVYPNNADVTQCPAHILISGAITDPSGVPVVIYKEVVLNLTNAIITTTTDDPPVTTNRKAFDLLFNSSISASSGAKIYVDDVNTYNPGVFSMSVANSQNITTGTASVDVDFSYDVNTSTFDKTKVKVTTPGGPDATISSIDFDQINTESFTINFGAPLQAGKTYTVEVGSDVKSVTGAVPILATFTTPAAADTTAPTVPTAVSASNIAQTAATITWTASTDNVGVTGYEVYVGGVLKEAVGNVTTYNLTGLSANTSYAVTVKAVDAANNKSAASAAANFTTLAAADTTAPTVPTAVAASNVAQTAATITWTASTDNVGVTGYEVYVGGVLKEAVGNVTTYSLTGLSANTSYTVTVKAVDAANNKSAASAVANFTTLAVADTTPPTVPTNLTATNVTATGAIITWTASTDNIGVMGYEVYVDGGLVGSSTATDFTLSGLSSDTTYSITVKAVDAGGNSSGFATLSLTTLAELSDNAFITGLSVTYNSTNATVTGTLPVYSEATATTPVGGLGVILPRGQTTMSLAIATAPGANVLSVEPTSGTASVEMGSDTSSWDISNLQSGANTVKITTISENETMKVYTLTITVQSGGSSGSSNKVGVPGANVPSGAVVAGTAVTLSSSTKDAVIYYTTDGSVPTTSSNKYTSPIEINEAVTIKAMGVKAGFVNSNVAEISYTIRKAKISWKGNASETRYLKVSKDAARPNDSITRYEMVDALNRLLDLEAVTIHNELTGVSEEYREIVAKFVGAGIINGLPDKSFSGDKGLTRAEFVKVMAIVLGMDINADAKSAFKDCSGHWAESYIAEFAKLKYLIGDGDGNFRPDAQITRAEFVTVINRIIKVKASMVPPKFSDLTAEHWGYADVMAVYLIEE